MNFKIYTVRFGRSGLASVFPSRLCVKPTKAPQMLRPNKQPFGGQHELPKYDGHMLKSHLASDL